MYKALIIFVRKSRHSDSSVHTFSSLKFKTMHFLTTLLPLITLAVRVAAMDTRRPSVETLPVYTRPPSYCTTGPASAAASIDLDVEAASGRTSSHLFPW
ncbi:hypothetical protein F5880DRAFT_1000605 [Lentinula raphanica]|nr:hypothetical protein F5880DRAFT_1000605 [Lentinula raphanica]